MVTLKENKTSAKKNKIIYYNILINYNHKTKCNKITIFEFIKLITNNLIFVYVHYALLS